MKRALILVIVAVLGSAAYLRAQAPPPLKLTTMRQIDEDGPVQPAAAVRSADAAVWVKLEWNDALAADTKLDVHWFDASGKVIVKGDATGKAGAKSCFTGIYIAGRSIAKSVGKYSVKVFEPGKTTPMAQADFTLEASIADPNKPDFGAKLGQSVEGAAITGATNAFFSDSKTVWLGLEAKKKLEAGHKIVPKIFTSQGKLALFGSPIEYKVGDDRLAVGFHIAGKDWARAGGDFVFKATWNDDPTPIASLPFKISTGNRWAVLVGIKDYPPAGPEGDLPGCDLDIKMMRDLLVNTYGVPEDHIKMVSDLEATKANIEKALIEMADKAGPNDAVIFHYSGHGAQTPDLDGDEEDGWDEAIVPAEVLPALVTTETDLNRFLTDDRIAELLSRFKTPNVTVIFDSCHSGTAVRAGEDDPPTELSFTKFRHFDYGRALMRKAQAAHRKQSNRSSEGRDGVRLVALNETQSAPATSDSVGVSGKFVFLASSRPWETSGCNGLGGFFTSSLVAALKNADGQSWAELMPKIQERVADYRPGQNPGVEGAIKRLPFSTAESSADAPYSRPFVAVVGAAKSGADKAEQVEEGAAGSHRALIEGYQSLYVEQVGALYDVYPKGDSTFTGKPSGRVRITGDRTVVTKNAGAGRPPIEQMITTADILSGSVHRGDRLLPVALPLPSVRPKVGVMVSSKAPAGEKDKLLATARGIASELQKTGSVDLPASFKFSEVDYVIEPRMSSGSVTAFIWSSGGWKAANFGGSDAEMALKVSNFITARHKQITRLVRLNNPSPPFRFLATLEGSERMFRAGETATIRVEANAPCYVTAMTAKGKGSVVCVSNEMLKPGSSLTIKVTVPADESGSVPIKLFATKEPLDAKAVELALSDGTVDALIAALQKRAGDGGAGNRFLGTDNWADATLRLSIGK